MLGAEDYQASVDAGHTKGHLGTLRWIWRAIDEFFGADATIKDVTFERVQAYVGWRRRSGNCCDFHAAKVQHVAASLGIRVHRQYPTAIARTA